MNLAEGVHTFVDTKKMLGHHMPRVKSILWGAASLAAAYCALTLGVFGLGQALAQTPPSPVIYLNQAWSQADRETFYQIPQGSQVISYDIFLNLEMPDSEQLFQSDSTSAKYGLITQSPNAQTNPDGLPIGLTKTVVTEGQFKGETVGLTCAACHVGQLNYQGKRVRIDAGVNNTFDFLAYMQAFDDAMQATLSDNTKFDRLATKLGAPDGDAKGALRKRYEADAGRLHAYRTRSTVAVMPWGPARIDALDLIRTRASSDLPGLPQNWITPIAPTKLPFLWNAPQGSWTQWSGVVQDPILRNFGETVGVFLSADLHSKTPAEGLFESSEAILNLQKIEGLLDRVAPPKWPEEVFGKIDRAKAAQGKKLFMSHCAECHNAYPYTWTAPNKFGKRFVEVGLVPQKYVGTDPSQFEASRPYALTGQLAPYLRPPFKDHEVAPFLVVNETIQIALLETALAKHKMPPAEEAALHGYRDSAGCAGTAECLQGRPARWCLGDAAIPA